MGQKSGTINSSGGGGDGNVVSLRRRGLAPSLHGESQRTNSSWETCAHNVIGKEESFNVLVTGCNAGLGYAICCRLIDEFLGFVHTVRECGQGNVSSCKRRGISNQKFACRNSLCIVGTTRDSVKGKEVTQKLREHVKRRQREQQHRSKLGGRCEDLTRKVHVEWIVLDLCSVEMISNATQSLQQGFRYLDVLVCNAGVGGWTGIDWWAYCRDIWSKGLINALIYPSYKLTRRNWIVGKKQDSMLTSQHSHPVKVKVTHNHDKLNRADSNEGAQTNLEAREIGVVFCANVLGHFALGMGISELLKRGHKGGKVIWISSLEAYKWSLNTPSDIQGYETRWAYECSKRVTDVLVLGSGRRLGSDEEKKICLDSLSDVKGMSVKATETINSTSEATVKIKNIGGIMDWCSEWRVCHPGICGTGIFPLSRILQWLMVIAFWCVRVFGGSRWHTVWPYTGAASVVWLISGEDENEKGECEVDKVKWGSKVSKAGRVCVSQTDYEPIDNEECEACWKGVEQLLRTWQRSTEYA